MSVINQMLSQLEERGVNTATGQGTVRAVPQARRNMLVPSLLVVVVLAVGIAIWQWMNGHDSNEVATVTAVSDENSINAGVSVRIEPGLQLSVELGSLPLPASLRRAADDFASDKVVASGRHTVDGPVLKTTEIVSALTPESSLPVSPISTVPSGVPAVSQQAAVSAQAIKQVSTVQQADAEFRKAVALMQQGRITDALAGYESVLRLDAGHDAARQALAALLLENKRGTEAERVLQEGLQIKPETVVFAMTLARLQVERGAVELSVGTLEKYLPYAGSQADYHAFLAALLQRQNRHGEAIAHYQIALQNAPGNGTWQMGFGISLQAMERNAEAKNAFRRALDTRTLSPELQAFVEQRIKAL